jgi:hypothetical protein
MGLTEILAILEVTGVSGVELHRLLVSLADLVLGIIIVLVTLPAAMEEIVSLAAAQATTEITLTKSSLGRLNKDLVQQVQAVQEVRLMLVATRDILTSAATAKSVQSWYTHLDD